MIFISALALIYVIVSAFSFNTLNFKAFYSSDEYLTYDETKFTYSIDENEDIIFVQEENPSENIYKYEVNKILKNNIDPKNIVTFEFDKKINYDFFIKGSNAYFFYNQSKSVNVICLEDKTYTSYNNLPEGIITINEFDNNMYIYNNNKLYKIDNLNNSYEYYSINNITNIKNVDFIDENTLVCSTYDADIYLLDIKTNNTKQISKKYLDYYIYNNNVYYTFSYDNKYLGIGYINKTEEVIFKVKSCDYEKMIVVDDYMYLISTLEINKVSISRQKRHERLQISTYQYMTFYLTDVIIVNEKLMYLPMIKKFDNYSLDEVKYSYHLYRYKI